MDPRHPRDPGDFEMSRPTAYEPWRAEQSPETSKPSTNKSWRVDDDSDMGRRARLPRQSEDDAESGLSSRERRRRRHQQEEEEMEYNYKPVNWRKVLFTPKYIPIHILLIVILVFTIFITVRHEQVVQALRPFSEKIRDIPAGWLIPIAILIIISFPPLFGHEIVGILIGVVWGLWIGFGILAAGTFIGEVATWFAFKGLLRRRALRLERTNLNYGAMARMARDGGFWMVLIIRFSAVPSHFSTAVFSTCNVKFWYFALATFLALPKQLVIVYLGVLLVEDQPDSVAKNVLLAVTCAVTVVMAIWIWWKMAAIKKVLLEEQDRRNQRKEAERLKHPGEYVGQSSEQDGLSRQRTFSDERERGREMENGMERQPAAWV